MFDVLLYLFENYVHNQSEVWLDEEKLNAELIRAGFHKEDIFKALDWLEDLAELQNNDKIPYLYKQTSKSMRVYTDEEQLLLDVECRGFLLFLEQINVLDMLTREMVLDRIVDIDKPLITLDDLKWVVLMVLFNVPGHEQAYTQMEDLLFLEPSGTVH